MTGYLDDVKRPLVFISPKISGYIKTIKVIDKNNKAVSLPIEYEKLFKK